MAESPYNQQVCDRFAVATTYCTDVPLVHEYNRNGRTRAFQEFTDRLSDQEHQVGKVHVREVEIYIYDDNDTLLYHLASGVQECEHTKVSA